MDTSLHLYTTSRNQPSSDTSMEGGEVDFVVPSWEEILIPNSELRDFVKTPKLLTREGRLQLRSLRSNPRRVARLVENPDTPEQNIETPSRSLTMPAESNIPRQPEKKGPLSKLFGWVSLPEDQFKFSTPRNNEVAEQEQTNFSVPNPQRTNIASPEFIHDQSYKDDVRENVQLNTYNKTHREEKPNAPFIWNHSDMDDNGIIWNYSD